MTAADDAGGGRRGRRPSPSAELDALLRRHWGVRRTERDWNLGGSANLNLLVTDDDANLFVARVYRSFVTPARLAGIQTVRSLLASNGIVTAEAVPTAEGEPWTRCQDGLVEVEPFVTSTARMDILERVGAALPVLGRIHTVLSDVALEHDAATPVFSNYLGPDDLPRAVGAGTRRIRSWNPTAREAELADVADRLAAVVADLGERCGSRGRDQLVHGDFWDNNVLFRGEAVSLVADFDFLGLRQRVEDLALTLYFVCLDIADLTEDASALRALIAAYESGLDSPLSTQEREALPLAMARQPLWSIGVWVALLDDEATARRHLAATATSLEWGLRLANGLARGGTRVTSF